ncbi:MAG TPA: fumarate hydratase [Oscillospiraceae bacterium]|nr:fumarate hydratase [Oscillospiraceae bacterium]HPS33839.1 fumarate hydratase [Oscillospiraceae bacterium]
MKTVPAREITRAIKQLYIRASTELPSDVTAKLLSCEKAEEGRAAVILNTMNKNIALAREKHLPICQDTGAVVVFAEIGQDVHIEGSFEQAINDGVAEACKDGFLRASIVSDPIRRKNTGDNTPAIIHIRLAEGDKIKLTVAPKGFGSENMSKIKMFSPAADKWDIADFVVQAVEEAAPNACAPLVVGVGLGGDFEQAAILAKKALCRSIDLRNPDPDYTLLENMILSGVNSLGIGPQGFGGRITALAVNVEYAPTHIAGLPVAVNIGCHVNRHAEIII